MLTRSTQPDDNFQIQIQTAAICADQAVSLTTAVAAQLGTDALTFDADVSDEISVDGVADTLLSSTNPVQRFAGGQLVELSPTLFEVDWNSGQSLVVENEGDYFNTSVLLGTQNGPGSVQGLLGGDTGQANDFQLADGTVLQQPLSDQQILSQFAAAWSVGANASLFALDASAAPEIDLGSGEQITIGGVDSDSVVFQFHSGVAPSVLNLITPQDFSGTVSGLTAGDEIDLTSFNSEYTSITDIVGTGAAGTTTNVTLTDADPGNPAPLSVTLYLMNLFANEFRMSASAYTVSNDQTPSHGALFQLAAHV